MRAIYRITTPDALIVRPLDSMTAIFQKSSGMTHIVADPVPAIVDVMADDALEISQVVGRLTDQYDIEDGDDAENIVAARLEELCQLGLADRVSVT
ncbi:HPr-rel-A system PqqD family peptide chaperone [Parasphingorhabdus sp.]|uniref:HPr-rel-A system PqqD family peptide chaperone n=1 Tax=Parasphingorhabdus sp. TaxID=2709688 RepID=UPI003264997E